MANTAADVLVERIIDWGVDLVFGLPGDGINGIMEALRTRQSKVRFIQVRHEEAAAFMACAYAKYTGRLGCCIATSGPGGIHLLNGLYDAKMDQAPVLAITGQTYSDLKGSSFQQEVNMTRLFDDVAIYNQEVINPSQVADIPSRGVEPFISTAGGSANDLAIDEQVHAGAVLVVASADEEGEIVAVDDEWIAADLAGGLVAGDRVLRGGEAVGELFALEAGDCVLVRARALCGPLREGFTLDLPAGKRIGFKVGDRAVRSRVFAWLRGQGIHED